MAKLTCPEIKAIKKALRAGDKEARALVEQGLMDDPVVRKRLLEIRELNNDLRTRLQKSIRPLSKWQRIMNMSRGLVTSRFYTSNNNLLGNALRMVNESGKVPARFVAEKMGASKEGVILGSIIENWFDLARARRPETKAVVDELLKLHNQYDRGFYTWASDIAKNVDADALTRTNRNFLRVEKVVDRLGGLNRASDNIFFRPAFLTRMREIARREGLDLTKVMDEKQFAKIRPEWVEEATDHAMAMTYKLEIDKALPRGGLLTDILQKTSENPNLQLIAPFPRFMANSYRFMLDHSPIGLWNGIASKDSRRIASGINGTLMILGAYQVRKSYGGENWYELDREKLGIGKGTVDVRRWAPFLAPYLLTVDAVERVWEGRAQPKLWREVAEQLSGANLRGGMGAHFVGFFEDMIKNEADPIEAAKEVTEKSVADFVGRFVAPLTQFKDFLAVFHEDTRLRRDTSRDPVGRVGASLTGGSGVLGTPEEPEAESATREATPRSTVGGAIARFGGQRLDEQKNRIEKELDEMGVSRTGWGSIAPPSGVPNWDRLFKKHLGVLADERSDAFLDGEYAEIEDRVREASGAEGIELTRQINREKRKALKGFFKELRAEAKERAIADDGGERLYAKKKAKGLGDEELARRQYYLPEEERIDPDEEEPDEEE